MKLAGCKPDHILLLQADLSDLPFRRECFETILCMNVLHHIWDARSLLDEFGGLLTHRGQLYLTSLVKSSRAFGDWYLDILYRRGDFVRPRTEVELRNLFEGYRGQDVTCITKGNMAYVGMTNFPE